MHVPYLGMLDFCLFILACPALAWTALPSFCAVLCGLGWALWAGLGSVGWAGLG